MRVSHASMKWLAPLGAMLLSLAILVRIAVPSGYMLAGDGSWTIVPCPAQGALPPHDALSPGGHHSGHHVTFASSDAHAHHGAESSDRRASTPSCPYGVLAAPALPPDPPFLASTNLAPVADAVASERPVSIVRKLAAPPPPSRGPPSLA